MSQMKYRCRAVIACAVTAVAWTVDDRNPAHAGAGCAPAWVQTFAPSTMPDGTVYALIVFDDGSGPAVYAGGDFSEAGSVTVNNIARWDGVEWSALFGPVPGPVGTGVQGEVRALAVFDDGSGPALYVGGTFLFAGGVMANRIARWDGAAWSGLSDESGTGVGLTKVSALAVFDEGAGPALFVGGEFGSAGGAAATNIARWDGSAWSSLPGGGVFGGGGSEVYALTVFDDGTGPLLHVGGDFIFAGGQVVSDIATWDGESWSALVVPDGIGVGGAVGEFPSVRAMTVHDDGGGPALYVAGTFTSAGGPGGLAVNRIARWDGDAWGALGGEGGVGANGTVLALSSFNDGAGAALFVGGTFTSAGGVLANRMARWSGTSWSALGTGVSGGHVFALAAVGPDSCGASGDLFVGGSFTNSPGGDSRLARWSGCPAPSVDLTCDGVVDGADLGVLLAAWGPCLGCPADLDGNGVVDGADLGLLLAEWG